VSKAPLVLTARQALLAKPVPKAILVLKVILALVFKAKQALSDLQALLVAPLALPVSKV